ncbi:hypothetical protein Dsin_022748 [Dipteronia sinensis]|uniref:Reverse transcriptase domain-containing protein n=1 Tax=Dipteronia sinensis TaxID=43782 RepID=A0AAE0A1Z3_9ROSI|nr:hypothetical protein Dsin_022748 [Dipteronia sinensis]
MEARTLGPNGINLQFVKANWEEIRGDFMGFLKEFHKDGAIVKELNRSFIALIPKVGKPETMGDFRPISLKGSMYKMASVSGRQILDSFVLADEIINSWKSDREGGILIKLDFEKAYDSVEFGFLDAMMSDMGFGNKWRGWINECISSPLVSVLVNRSSTNQFGIERGLRQGDPLSPFLFNIVTEGLSCVLKKAVRLGLIKGETFNGSGIHISHLQFADDTILFLKPKKEFILNAKRILRCFEMASGLSINYHKTCLVRVGKRKSEEPEPWAEVFKCRKENLPISYLGLPLGANPRVENFWKPVLERIEKRLAPWKRKFLSKGGRLVLIKSILSSIPTYYLSVFKILIEVAQKIEKLQRSFLWGDGSMKRKLRAVD